MGLRAEFELAGCTVVALLPSALLARSRYLGFRVYTNGNKQREHNSMDSEDNNAMHVVMIVTTDNDDANDIHDHDGNTGKNGKTGHMRKITQP